MKLGKDGVFVDGLKTVEIADYEDAIMKLQNASQNRSVVSSVVKLGKPSIE